MQKQSEHLDLSKGTIEFLENTFEETILSENFFDRDQIKQVRIIDIIHADKQQDHYVHRNLHFLKVIVSGRVMNINRTEANLHFYIHDGTEAIICFMPLSQGNSTFIYSFVQQNKSFSLKTGDYVEILGTLSNFNQQTCLYIDCLERKTFEGYIKFKRELNDIYSRLYKM